MSLEKTVYIGTFIHCQSLTELDIVDNGAVGVDEQGKIAFVHRDRHATSLEQGWKSAKIVDSLKHGFFFPGFIGEQ